MYTRHYLVDALIIAIKENNYDDVLDLVKLINERSPASLFTFDEENKTLLHVALATGNEEISNFLFDEMKNNKAIYTKDNESRTVFWYAAKDSFCDIFVRVLNQAKEDEQQTLIFECDVYKSTLLHKIAWFGQHKIIEILFNYVISDKDKEFINQADNEGDTALHKSYQALLEYRKKQSIDSIAQDSINEFIQIIVQLLQNGAEIQLFNNENITAFRLHRQLPIEDQEHILIHLKKSARIPFLKSYAQLFDEQRDQYDQIEKNMYIRFSGMLSLVELIRSNYLCNPLMTPRAFYRQIVSVRKDQIMSFQTRGYTLIESNPNDLESEKGKEKVQEHVDKNGEVYFLMAGQEVIPEFLFVEMPKIFKNNLKSDILSDKRAKCNISRTSSNPYHYQHSNNDRLVLNCLIRQMEDYLASLQSRSPQAEPLCRAATIIIPTGTICFSLAIIFYCVYRAVDAYSYLESNKKMLDSETKQYYREQMDLYGALAVFLPWLLILPVAGLSLCSTNLWNIEKKISHLEYQQFMERLEMISNGLTDIQGLQDPIHHDIQVQLLEDIGLLKENQNLQDSINIFARCIDALKVIRRDVTNNKKLSAYSLFSRREIVITVNEDTPLQQIPQFRLNYGSM